MSSHKPPTFNFQSATSPAALMDELEKFIVFWLGPRRPEFGEPESTLETFPLPYPLRRLYAFAGRWPPQDKYRAIVYTGHEANVFSVQDSLRPFSSLRSQLTEDGKIDFLVENQGEWTCLTLPEGDDPPVWVEGNLGNHGEVVRMLVSESLSRFLVTFCLQESLLGSGLSVDHNNLARVFESFKARPITLWSQGPYVCSNDYHFYLLDGKVLVGQLGSSIWFAHRSG